MPTALITRLWGGGVTQTASRGVNRETTAVSVQGLWQRETLGWLGGGAGLAHTVLVWAAPVRPVLVRGGGAGPAAGLGRLPRPWWDSLAPGVILGSAWYDQHGLQVKTFLLEAGTASLAVLPDTHLHVVSSDASEPVVAAVALTWWNCPHASCHSASKNNSCLFWVTAPPSVQRRSPLAIGKGERTSTWICVCFWWGGI